MAGTEKKEFLGIFEDKEWWLDNGELKYRVWNIREAIRPAPGNVFVGSDFSQIEVKLMAFLSQDPWLIQAINSGVDIHCYMAADCSDGLYIIEQMLYAKKNEDLADEDPMIYELCSIRTGIKTVTFGIPYGAEEDRIAGMIRKKDKQGKYIESGDDAKARARSIIDKYFKKASQLKIFLDDQVRLCHEFGLSRSPKGRIRWYVMPERSDYDYKQQMASMGRQAKNHKMQGGNVDLLKPAVARCYRNLRGGKSNGTLLYPGTSFKLLVHDEILLETPEKYGEPVKEILEEAMTWSYEDIKMTFNGEVKYLKDIYNKVKVVIADSWKK